MFAGVLSWLKETYFEEGRYRSALLEDLFLLGGFIVGLYSIDWNKELAFFDIKLTKHTFLMVFLVMIGYHILWRVLEAGTATREALAKENLWEQAPRLVASACLLGGMFTFSKNVQLFVSLLVGFYFFLFLWQLLISENMRRVRGTFVFDLCGLICAIAFAYVAFNLYRDAKHFIEPLPKAVRDDPESLSAFLPAFAGAQVTSFYYLGLWVGAMAANSVLALLSGIRYRAANLAAAVRVPPSIETPKDA